MAKVTSKLQVTVRSPRSGAKPGDTELDLRSDRRRHEQVPGSVLPGVSEHDRLRLHQPGEGTAVKHQHG